MWRRHKGRELEDEMDDLEKTLSLQNLGGTSIDSTFPIAQQGTSFHIVDNGGTLYFVLVAKGKRYRTTLTEF